MAKQSNSTAGNQPISRHPLFPAIVALWCGAAGGIASLGVSPGLVEHLVVAAGIDRVIPMAASPLGNTARILVALAMTGAGVVIGALGALRYVRGGGARPAGTGTEEASAKSSSRRRRLASAPEETSPLVVLPSPPPVASNDHGILNVAEFDLGDFAPEPEAAEPGSPNRLFDALVTSHESAPLGEDTVGVAVEAEAETIVVANESPISGSSLTESAPTPQPRSAADPIADNLPRPQSAADRIASAELEDLSPLQLVERLAIAMARSREQAQHAAEVARAMAESAAAETEAVEAAPVIADTAAEAEPEEVVDPIALPRMLASVRPAGTPLAAPLDGDEDDALPGYVPPRHISLNADASADALDAGYSSLVGLTRPIAADADAPAPARPFDAPTLDAAGEVDPDDTERALRTALATLQRMSGAA